MPLWEVFVRSKQGLEHKHCAACTRRRAAALQMARDVYTRRQRRGIWVCRRHRSPPANPMTRASSSSRRRQDLPPSQLLRDSRRSGPHVWAQRRCMPLPTTCCTWPTTRWCWPAQCRWCGHGPVLEEDIALTTSAWTWWASPPAVPARGVPARRGRHRGQPGYFRDTRAFRNYTCWNCRPTDPGRPAAADRNSAHHRAQLLYSHSCCWPGSLQQSVTRSWRRSRPSHSRKCATTCAMRATGWCAWAMARRRPTPRTQPRSTTCCPTRRVLECVRAEAAAVGNGTASIRAHCSGMGRRGGRGACGRIVVAPPAAGSCRAAGRSATPNTWASCWPRCGPGAPASRAVVTLAGRPGPCSKPYPIRNPVVSIRELGILREVHDRPDGVEVVITPTYAAARPWARSRMTCAAPWRPAHPATVVHPPGPGLDQRLDHRSLAGKTAGLRHRPTGCSAATACCGSPGRSIGAAIPCPHCGSAIPRDLPFQLTACKSLHKCLHCLSRSNHFKPI